jgi:CCR4-NOT transcription complex subunit 3
VWANLSEIKDKGPLTENRKLIEQEMEKFKAIEKELKTKAFSKEGLNQNPKIDPEEQIKEQRKMDASKSERLTMLDHRMERHKFHINNLELILRLLDNNSVTVEQVNQIKDDINYYIDENHDDDFQDDDEIYAELNLEEMGGFGAFGDHSDEEEGIFNWNSCGRNASTK